MANRAIGRAPFQAERFIGYLCYASIMRRFVLPPVLRSLSARLLVLTIFFVMLGEVMIFAPSVGRFRITYLESKIAAGHLAVLALEATPDNEMTGEIDRKSTRLNSSHANISYAVFCLQKMRGLCCSESLLLFTHLAPYWGDADSPGVATFRPMAPGVFGMDRRDRRIRISLLDGLLDAI